MSENSELVCTFKRLKHARDLPLPRYESQQSAGMDLRAALAGELTLKPGERQLIPTGLQVAIPPGFEGQIRPRSGLAFRQGITMLNTPGTIDSDYRGEVKVLAINHGSDDYVIKRGDRIAQMVISPVIQAKIVESEILDHTERNEGGFGSTGVQ